MWQFAPTLIFPNLQIVPLPRPILQLRVQDGFEATPMTVPFRDGSVRRGRSRGGVDIAIRGQLARSGDDLAFSEPEMFDAIESVRLALLRDDPEETYGLALYRFVLPEQDLLDSDRLRGFAECTTVKFEYDLSDRAIYGYSLIVHASDPVVHDPLLPN